MTGAESVTTTFLSARTTETDLEQKKKKKSIGTIIGRALGLTRRDCKLYRRGTRVEREREKKNKNTFTPVENILL